MKKKHRNSTTGMKIAIIGGGFTGLTAAYELGKLGHQVTVFEKDKTLGGLANGFKEKGWNWHLEMAYHHLFTNDTAILNLIKELGLTDKLIIKRPITANYVSSSVIPGLTRDPSSAKTSLLPASHGFRLRGRNDNDKTILPFDAPIHLLTYPGLTIIDKLRTGVLLAILKINPFWQPLESITAKQLFLSFGGRRAWEAIWEPLMVGKFGKYSDSVAANWLWARIKKRTPKLYYIEGGFHTLVNALEQTIREQGGTIHTGVEIPRIESRSKNQELGKTGVNNHNSKFIIHNSSFDSVLLTVPTPIAAKLVPGLTSHFSLLTSHSPLSIPHLHAQTLILETKEPILKDVYWLNITDRSFPFLAVVAHTNMIDKKHYGGHHLTYFGNYLPEGHPYLSMTKKQLLKVFLPYIKRLNQSGHLSLVSCRLFVGLFAQPVHTLHYSQRAPKLNLFDIQKHARTSTLQTLNSKLFLANLDSIYPWDRGTNYAVELGQRAAHAMSSRTY